MDKRLFLLGVDQDEKNGRYYIVAIHIQTGNYSRLCMACDGFKDEATAEVVMRKYETTGILS
jgi:hypothetical protein